MTAKAQRKRTVPVQTEEPKPEDVQTLPSVEQAEPEPHDPNLPEGVRFVTLRVPYFEGEVSGNSGRRTSIEGWVSGNAGEAMQRVLMAQQMIIEQQSKGVRGVPTRDKIPRIESVRSVYEMIHGSANDES